MGFPMITHSGNNDIIWDLFLILAKTGVNYENELITTNKFEIINSIDWLASFRHDRLWVKISCVSITNVLYNGYANITSWLLIISGKPVLFWFPLGDWSNSLYNYFTSIITNICAVFDCQSEMFANWVCELVIGAKPVTRRIESLYDYHNWPSLIRPCRVDSFPIKLASK